MPTTDLPPTPEERFREIAAILADGLLRLRTCPQATPAADMPDGHADRHKSSESAGKPLGFSATPRTDCPNG